MSHDLPGPASFWSFRFAIGQDLADTARKNACPCGGRLRTAPITSGKATGIRPSFQSHRGLD